MPLSPDPASAAGRLPDISAPGLETRRIGHLRLTSGRLVACDPFTDRPQRPFARQVPVGEFPVELVISHQDGEARVAFARIAFSTEPAVTWEPALVEGEDSARLQDGGSFGYGVDTGTGAFMDASTWQEYERRMTQDRPGFSELLYSELDRNDTGTFYWLVLPLGPGTIALFSSGYGDGGYASHWAYDREGRLAALVTDFQVVSTAP